MAQCSSRTIVGKILDAIQSGDLRELEKCRVLIQEDDATRKEFYECWASSDDTTSARIKTAMPDLFPFIAC